MGFWQTGYLEFHESVGLGDYRHQLLPVTFPCKHCGEVCQSVQELRQHRFESHPIRSPVLFLRGRELGRHRFPITRCLTEDDVKIIGCDQAFLNKKKVSVSDIPQKLADISSNYCELTLQKDDVVATFNLDFCIAHDDDLLGIEARIDEMRKAGKLDIRSLDKFASAKSEFKTAVGYCDGIYSYLLGIKIKKRDSDVSLPQNEYVKKYNNAVNKLAGYDRPLAKIIGGLIGFHFNHFKKPTYPSTGTQVERAARIYVAWMGDKKINTGTISDGEFGALERSVIDRHTEQIVHWAIRPYSMLYDNVAEIESVLESGLEEYDKVKVKVLLAETYRDFGDDKNALRHAKALRNRPHPVGEWAESMIGKIQGDA